MRWHVSYKPDLSPSSHLVSLTLPPPPLAPSGEGVQRPKSRERVKWIPFVLGYGGGWGGDGGGGKKPPSPPLTRFSPADMVMVGRRCPRCVTAAAAAAVSTRHQQTDKQTKRAPRCLSSPPPPPSFIPPPGGWFSYLLRPLAILANKQFVL